MSELEAMAVQSYCFRGFEDNREVACLVRECGLSRIELCAKHVDFNDPSTWEDVLAIYAGAGVEIVSIGVQGFRADEAAARNSFAFCKKAGIRVISANFSPESVPEAYRIVESLATEYDVRLGIHNHGGRHWLGNAEMLASVFADTSPRIGLMLDTAWALDAGENPVAMVTRFADRLVGLHIKDFTFDSARKPEDVVIGSGNLSLPDLKAALLGIGFMGIPILEYEGDVENPVPALKQCVEAWNAVL